MFFPTQLLIEYFFRLSGLPTYLGGAINKSIPDKLSAHAWLRCGSSILTGADGHRQFTVVSTFSTDKH